LTASFLSVGTFIPYRRAPGSSLLDRHRGFAKARWQGGFATALPCAGSCERGALMPVVISFDAGSLNGEGPHPIALDVVTRP
jgi:hypothetical protein